MGIKNLLKNLGKNTVFYPGCLTRYILAKETENYKKILNKLKIDFIMLPDILCCGSPVLNAGYEADARKLARKNFEIFKKYNTRKIITNCPACYKTLKEYKEMIPDWNIEVEHIITTILNHLRKKDISYPTKEKVTYHDPCHLGRHSGIYEEPREILNRLGYEIIEMRNNRQDALCCGGGAGLRVNNPELAKKIAEKRISQAKDIKVKKIITPCPLCFTHMLNKEIEIEEFSYAVAEALGLKPEKTKSIDTDEIKEACS